MQQLVHKGGKKQMSVIETNGDSRGVLKVFQERVSNQNLLEKYSQTSRLCQTQHPHDPGAVFFKRETLLAFLRHTTPQRSRRVNNQRYDKPTWNVSIETQVTDRQF